jgi:hypothetical protein
MDQPNNFKNYMKMSMFKKKLTVFLLLCMFVFPWAIAFAADLPSTSVNFENPIVATTVSALVSTILSNLRGVIVGIALVFIVIGAMMYILSAGDDKRMTTAKATITAALIGLAIALAAPSFLDAIITILGGKTDGLATDSISGALTIKKIVENVLNFLLAIIGLLSMIGLVVGGSYYLTAYGDEKRAETGKKMITASIIGIVVALGALSIVNQLASFFE